MGKALKIDDAVERFSEIMEEIISLESRAIFIVRELLNAKAKPRWHKLIVRATKEMESELADLEDEAVEQEEAAELSEQVLGFCKKYPKVNLSESLKKEMASQGFSVSETKRLVIIETPYSDYPLKK